MRVFNAGVPCRSSSLCCEFNETICWRKEDNKGWLDALPVSGYYLAENPVHGAADLWNNLSDSAVNPLAA